MWKTQVALPILYSGYPDGTFRPNNPITRTELIAALVKTGNLNALSYDSRLTYFADYNRIPSWAHAALDKGLDHNLIASYPASYRFEPTNNALRAEVAVSLYQLLAALGRVPAIHIPQLSGSHLQPGIVNYYRTEMLGFSRDNRYFINLQTTINGGTGSAFGFLTIGDLTTGNDWMADGVIPPEDQPISRDTAINLLLARSRTVRSQLQLTPPSAAIDLPETERMKGRDGSETVFFRSKANHRTYMVTIKVFKTSQGEREGSSYRIELEDGHTLYTIDRSADFRPFVYNTRIKGLMITPDYRPLILMLEDHKQGFETMDIETALVGQTL